MARTSRAPNQGERRRRADAERSVAQIMDAAVDALADDPEASMVEIARRAGVVRATVYVHFPTREALIAAVTRRAVSEVSRTIESAEPQRGDATDALRRAIRAAWRKLGRYHSLVEINMRLRHEELHDRHGSVLETLQPLIERGQRERVFRTDVPAGWHLAMIMALIHAASAELSAGRMPPDEVEAALVTTLLGAIGSGP